MPDRYDPKLTVRPPGERKAAEPTVDGDPLAELARIVSGKPPTESPSTKGRAPSGSGQDADPDIERDLEAELLNDLQASFAALSAPLDTAEESPDPETDSEPESPPVPAPPGPTSEAAAEPRAPEPKPEPPARKPEAFNLDIDQTFDEAEAAAARVVRAEQVQRREPREPRPYNPPMRGPAALTRNEGPARPEAPARPSAPPRPALPARAEQAGAETGAAKAGRPASAAVTERPAPPRRIAPPRSERPNIPVRPLPMDDEPHALEPPSRTVTPRPPRAEPPASPLPSRFAPQRAAMPPPGPPPRRNAVPPPPEPIAQDEFGPEIDDLAGDIEGPYEDDFTLDDLDLAYESDDEFPPFPEDEMVEGRRRRSGRAFAVIAVMLAVVAVGGAAVFLYSGDGSGNAPPPIIAADNGPTKVAPDTPDVPAESDSQSKLIYDRVAGTGEANDTRLVTGQSEIGNVPADDGVDEDNPISRVIIPGGPGIDSPTAPGAGETATSVPEIPDAPSDDQPGIGPRMVRTVVVKPDGTIVSSEATGVDEDGNALPGTDEDASMAADDDLLPSPPRTEMDSVLEGGDLPVNPDPLGNPGPQEPTTVAEAPPATEPVSEPDMPDLPTPQPEPPPAAAAPEPAPQPPAAQPPAQVAARNGNGPIDLTPGTAPAAGSDQSGGGVLVQVSAQRSEETATSAYRGLQQRFPNILGAFQPKIVRADLGERGVFYRVRIGPFSGADATRLCEDLKAAGGDCILAR